MDGKNVAKKNVMNSLYPGEMSLENILEMRHEKTLVLQSECSNHYARLKVLFVGPEGLVVITLHSHYMEQLE